jgi:hypothetical protein
MSVASGYRVDILASPAELVAEVKPATRSASVV